MQPSKQYGYIDPRSAANVLNLTAQDVAEMDLADLARIGITLKASDVERMMRGMDALQPLVTTPTVMSPVQFLQSMLPGYVAVATQARKIDTLIGVANIGEWEDEEIVQGVLENTGRAALYGDLTNMPLANYNPAWERRTVVRFELGMRVGRLEEKRASRMGINSADAKRNSVQMALDYQRNLVGFLGFNGGGNRTYGLLNETGLPAYITVATQNATTLWSGKNFQGIIADLRIAFAQLRTQSGDIIDPKTTRITLLLPTNTIDYLSVTSDQGIGVMDWLNKNYPNVRIESAPELNAANGGANVFYLYAETVNDGGTDDNRTIVQVVPSRAFLLGTQQLVKGYEEDYSNATAGVMVKRPWAIVRYTGI